MQSINNALFFERFCYLLHYDDSTFNLYQSFLKNYNENKKIESVQSALKKLHHRFDQIVSAHNGKKLQFTNIGKIAIGLGNEHPTENGFVLDRNTGIPYLPATVIKGVCRALARLTGKESHIAELLGNSYDDEFPFQGDIVFLPAYPEKVPALEIDVITNHHQDYYGASPEKRCYSLCNDKDKWPSPMDIESPIPVFHLAISEGQIFTFRFFSISQNKENEERIFALLVEALQELGIGARTAVGYGRMELKDPEKQPTQTWEIEPMQGIVKTFISYSWKDQDKVFDFVAKGAIYGITPWIDQNNLMPALGQDLWQTIEMGLQEVSVQTVFLSRQAIQSENVCKEIIKARELSRHIIPILLDSSDDIKQFLKEELKIEDPFYLKFDDLMAHHKWANSIFKHAGIIGTDKIVLALNHRETHPEPRIPSDWQKLPILDMRSMEYWKKNIADSSEGNLLSFQDWNPDNPDNYYEYEKGFQFLRTILPSTIKLYITGLSPLGIAGMIGKYWDRGTGAKLITWNTYEQQEWLLKSLHTSKQWSETDAKYIFFKNRKDLSEAENAIAVCHFVANDRGNVQYEDAVRWIEQNLNVKTVLHFSYPEVINNENFENVVKECVGTFMYARNELMADTIHWFAGLPMALMPHIVFMTRAIGKIIFYDQDKRNHTYIKAFEKN
jgi:CRISPR-associated protein Cmr6